MGDGNGTLLRSSLLKGCLGLGSKEEGAGSGQNGQNGQNGQMDNFYDKRKLPG